MRLVRSATLATVLPLLAVGCTDVQPSPAQETRIAWNGDILSAGTNVIVSTAIPGDAMLAGGTVTLSGSANGSLMGAGGRVTFSGEVGQSVRAAGRTVRLNGTVARNVTAAGGSVTLGEEGRIQRNAYLAGGAIEVLGAIEGSARLAGGRVLIDGPVGGDVVVEAEELRLGPDARIGGDLEYRVGRSEPSIDPQANVAGEIRAVRRDSADDDEGGPIGRALFYMFRLLAFLLTGVIVVALFPAAAARTSQAARTRPLAALGTGLVVLLGVPLVIGMAVLSLIGIPLALMLAVLYAIALYLSPIPASLWLGDRILTRRPGGTRMAEIVPFLVGGAIIAIAIFVPFLGWLVRLLVALLGLGAATLAIHGAAGGGAEAS